METSVQEALKIGLVNNQIHTLVISGGTGVGKSYILRQCLEAWHIPLSFDTHLCRKFTITRDYRF